MAYRNTHTSFLTPEKKLSPDKPPKGLPTTQGSKFGRIRHSSYSPVIELQSEDLGIGVVRQQKMRKLYELQSEVNQLKNQLNSSPSSKFAANNHRFSTQEKLSPTLNEEHTLLKELGCKVQGLIKQNSRLRKGVPTEELEQVKVHHMKIKELMKEAIPSPSNRFKVTNQIEDNLHIREYIEKKNNQNVSQLRMARDRILESPTFQRSNFQERTSSDHTTSTPEPKKPQQTSLDEELIAQNIKNMKNYFTLYINTAIEANDDKLASYRKYIDTLQKRVASLEQIQQRFKHYKFEQQVKLQESGKKKKNISIAGPNVPGDFAELSVIEQEPAQPIKQPLIHQYFPNKDKYMEIQDSELRSELNGLRQENKNLQELYQIVKQNYQREIEEHIRDNAERQKLLYTIQKLQAENKLLREQPRRIQTGQSKFI